MGGTRIALAPRPSPVGRGAGRALRPRSRCGGWVSPPEPEAGRHFFPRSGSGTMQSITMKVRTPRSHEGTMSKINLKKFEKNLVVRPLKPGDYEGVADLQRRCFPGMDPWTREQFSSQIQIFPEGQIGVEYQGKLVASSSSLILDF